MKELIGDTVYFGVAVSILGYAIGYALKKRINKSFINPLLIAIVFVIAVLLVFDIDYESYNKGAKYLSYLLTPTTVCLAIPLYLQLDLLKKNIKAVIGGIISGVISSLLSIFTMAWLFGLSHEQYVSLLPKSVTTAIGIGISEELGGITALTVGVIILTGVLGSIIGEGVCKLFRIKDPIAVGLAIGTASHAIGTSRAIQIGEIEGAMSSLSIAVAGLLTVIGASVFSYLL